MLSLSEIRGAVGAAWPDLRQDRPAVAILKRATKAADLSGDGTIGRREFGFLLECVAFFHNEQAVFSAFDVDGDQQLSLEEFRAAAAKLGEDLSDRQAAIAFGKMDLDGSGLVSFDEFCSWMARRNVVEPDDPEAGGVDGESLVLIYDEMAIEQLRAVVGNPAVEAVPALAVQCVLVFGGHSAAWDGCSVATIARTPDTGGWAATKPLSALLNDWQNPKALKPLSGPTDSYVYGYAVRLAPQELGRLDRYKGCPNRFERRALTIGVRDSYGGRSFTRQPAFAYCRAGYDAAKFKAPGASYLESRQANIGQYWELSPALPICRLDRQLVYVYETAHGRARFDNEDELKQLFLVIGLHRRWRLPADADRCVQKLHAIGITSTKALKVSKALSCLVLPLELCL
eukprot:SAG22_NODE_3304_length_1791_cov_1.654255_1_plen_400_part_00